MKKIVQLLTVLVLLAIPLACKKTPAPEAPTQATIGNMAYIEGGKLEVDCTPNHPCSGDKLKTRTVKVKPYYLDITEVTNDQYRECVDAGACDPPVLQKWFHEKPGDHPCVNITWIQADNYCRWRDKRLPTDDEWEFAARDGQTHEHPEDLDDIAWYRLNSGWQPDKDNPGEGYYTGTTTHRVGTKRPNSLGVFDLIGNAWEWSADEMTNKQFFTPGEAQGSDSTLPYYHLHGGSWYSFADYCDYSFTTGVPADHWGVTIGFRCASSLPPTPPTERR